MVKRNLSNNKKNEYEEFVPVPLKEFCEFLIYKGKMEGLEAEDKKFRIIDAEDYDRYIEIDKKYNLIIKENKDLKFKLDKLNGCVTLTNGAYESIMSELDYLRKEKEILTKQ